MLEFFTVVLYLKNVRVNELNCILLTLTSLLALEPFMNYHDCVKYGKQLMLYKNRFVRYYILLHQHKIRYFKMSYLKYQVNFHIGKCLFNSEHK